MIFLNMEPKNYFKKQQGVTLLLAIILLAAILSISFSIATILFIEIRVSGDLTRTEASLYAANGVSEQAIFNYKRDVCSVSGQNCSYVSAFNNGVTLNGSPTINTTSTPVLTILLAPGKTKILDFCSAVATTTGCGYGKVTVQNVLPNQSPPDQVNLYMCEWNAANTNPTLYGTGGPCSDKDNYHNYWLFPYSGGTSYQVVLNSLTNLQAQWTSLNPDYQQELSIINNGSKSVYLSVSTFGADGNPLGLPYVGSTSVTVDTSNATVGRRILVTVPSFSGSIPSTTASTFATTTHFSVTAPSPVTKNVPFNFTVTALDASGSTATNYSGLIHFTTSNGSVWSPPSDSSLTNGIGTFSGLITGEGTYTLTATDVDNGTIVGISNSVIVPTNVALAANGGVAFAPSQYSSGYAATIMNDGYETAKNLGSGIGGAWQPDTRNAFPYTVGVTFSGTHTISEIDVFSIPDNYASVNTITATTPASSGGISGYTVEYQDINYNWVTAGSVSGYTLDWKKINFAPVSARAVRVTINASNSLAGWPSVAEIEAY